ncbi:hypothetical protein CSPX01_10253 [Colletotrichum filicis]|nr:hypothetical protein CSPX01_10253 [Colletotrichum filicis]
MKLAKMQDALNDFTPVVCCYLSQANDSLAFALAVELAGGGCYFPEEVLKSRQNGWRNTTPITSGDALLIAIGHDLAVAEAKKGLTLVVRVRGEVAGLKVSGVVRSGSEATLNAGVLLVGVSRELSVRAKTGLTIIELQLVERADFAILSRASSSGLVWAR